MKGLEPLTYRLQGCCATIAPHQHKQKDIEISKNMEYFPQINSKVNIEGRNFIIYNIGFINLEIILYNSLLNCGRGT